MAVSARRSSGSTRHQESAEKSGRYGSRAKQVAARTVIKERKKKGHAKGR